MQSFDLDTAKKKRILQPDNGAIVQLGERLTGSLPTSSPANSSPDNVNILAPQRVSDTQKNLFLSSSSESSAPLKECAKCHKHKPLDQFFRHSGRKDGRTSYCRDCQIAYKRRWRQTPDIRHDTAEKILQEANKDHFKKRAQSRADRRHRERYPARDRCRKLFYRAIRSGKIIRPDHCSVCGRKCKPQGHHDDYKKPYDVIWACHRCHNILDAQRRRREAA